MAHTVNLRRVGGSIMLAIPPAVLDVLGLSAGAPVDLAIEAGRLVVQPKGRPRYTLDELLAQDQANAPIADDEREWLDAAPVGREII
jgi:antitoxin ChpS